MGMTNYEKLAKKQIIKRLLNDGYPKYAKLLDGRDLDTGKKIDKGFDINLTKQKGVTAYVDMNNARIVINQGFHEKDISVVIRHELLHSFLKHQKRLLDHVARSRGLDPDELDNLTMEELINYIYSPSSPFNVVADFEISNVGYTDKDKDTIRNLILDGETISGLVTEDHHKDWTELSLEDMWDKAMDEREKKIQEIMEKYKKNHPENDLTKPNVPEIQDISGSLSDDGLVFVDEDGVEYGF